MLTLATDDFSKRQDIVIVSTLIRSGTIQRTPFWRHIDSHGILKNYNS